MDDALVRQLRERVAESMMIVMGDKWEVARELVLAESARFARGVAGLVDMRADQTLSESHGRALLEIYSDSMKTALTTLEDVDIILARESVNAAGLVVGEMVNSSAGWELFPGY